jgi:hypothetical protein
MIAVLKWAPASDTRNKPAITFQKTLPEVFIDFLLPKKNHEAAHLLDTISLRGVNSLLNIFFPLSLQIQIIGYRTKKSRNRVIILSSGLGALEEK